MARNWLLAVALSAAAAPLVAAPFTVPVGEPSGKPVPEAAVTLYPAAASPIRSSRTEAHFVVSQHNLQFHPFVSIVPVGADVAFPNRDSTKHHVYSFAPAKKFELKLFAKDRSRTVHFDKAGVVARGCNIHHQMSAFIVVTDNPWTTRTNAHGIATCPDVPSSARRLVIWHPFLRAPGGEVQQPLGTMQHSATVAIRLHPPPAAMPMLDY